MQLSCNHNSGYIIFYANIKWIFYIGTRARVMGAANECQKNRRSSKAVFYKYA
jgi:hypothetical protein